MATVNITPLSHPPAPEAVDAFCCPWPKRAKTRSFRKVTLACDESF